MKPLNVALIHRDSDRCMDKRMVGIWSSPVPEFRWRHFPMHKGFRVDKSEMRSLGYDLIFMEDGKLCGDFVGSGPPVAYYVVDSTLSEGHLIQRREQARQADLVLVDHDELSNLKVGPPVRRLSHCVNTDIFKDYRLPKDVDVSFHCRTKGSADRADMQARLGEFCKDRGYVYERGTRYDEEYAKAFNRSKLTVNLSRTPTNRPHRIFDAMACVTCLVSNRLPYIENESRRVDFDYIEYWDTQDLFAIIDRLLRNDEWQRYAVNGYYLVHSRHSWPVRAKQLREILSEELGI